MHRSGTRRQERAACSAVDTLDVRDCVVPSVDGRIACRRVIPKVRGLSLLHIRSRRAGRRHTAHQGAPVMLLPHLAQRALRLRCVGASPDRAQRRAASESPTPNQRALPMGAGRAATFPALAGTPTTSVRGSWSWAWHSAVFICWPMWKCAQPKSNQSLALPALDGRQSVQPLPRQEGYRVCYVRIMRSSFERSSLQLSMCDYTLVVVCPLCSPSQK